MKAVPTFISLRKAYNDKYLNEDEFKALKRIIQSKDNSDVLLTGSIFIKKISDALTKNLNKEQKEVFNNIMTYIFDDKPIVRACLLNGSAGTGKTTVISKIIYAITVLCPKDEINVNAPTHKAIRLLQGKCSNVLKGHINFKTTHSTLGLKRIVDESGKVKFKGNPNSSTDIKLMFVDEVSMIEDELFKLILDSKTYSKTRIVLIGDRKQLPPVNSKDSYIFTNAKHHNVTQLNLTQIVRQVSDNPIVKFTKMVGDNIDNPFTLELQTEITPDGDGVIVRREEQLDKIINYWYKLPEVKKNGDIIRILAWTNEEVDRMNRKVRNVLFNNPTEPFVKGDRIIAKEPLFYNGSQFADNSDEFTVDFCETITIEKTVPISDEVLSLDFYKIHVDEIEEPILLIHPNSIPLYQKKLLDLHDYAVRKHDSKIWSKYYSMKDWNNNINYAYAGTIHTSQGSTYENTIILLNDIEKNHNFVDKNKLRYTAFTRAKKKLIIVAMALSKKLRK